MKVWFHLKRQVVGKVVVYHDYRVQLFPTGCESHSCHGQRRTLSVLTMETGAGSPAAWSKNAPHGAPSWVNKESWAQVPEWTGPLVTMGWPWEDVLWKTAGLQICISTPFLTISLNEIFSIIDLFLWRSEWIDGLRETSNENAQYFGRTNSNIYWLFITSIEIDFQSESEIDLELGKGHVPALGQNQPSVLRKWVANR